MRILAFISLVALGGACTASREVPPSSQVVTWKATSAPARTDPSGASLVDVALTGQVESGWKVYSLTQGGGGPVAMTVKVPDSAVYSIEGLVSGPAPDKAMDPNFNIETETYSSSATFRLTLKVPQGADAGAPIELKVRSQACSDKLCLPARTTTVTVAPGPS